MNESDKIREMTCDEVRDSAAAFVLGALEPTEAAAVRAHLETCADAHAEIAELGGVLPVLAESVPVVEPPAGLKARIMAAAAADLEARSRRAPTSTVEAALVSSPPTALAEPSPAPTAAPAEPSPAPTAAPAEPSPAPTAAPIPFPTATERETRRSRASTASWALRIAAVVAIVALGGWNLLLRNDLGNARSYEQSVATVLSVAAQPGSTTAIITPAGGTGAGLAAISATGQVTLAMQDLAPTAGQTVYTAWAIAGEAAPVSLGDFKVGSSGLATFEGNGAPSQPGLVLALTLEPNAGNQAPQGTLVAKGVSTGAT